MVTLFYVDTGGMVGIRSPAPLVVCKVVALICAPQVKVLDDDICRLSVSGFACTANLDKASFIAPVVQL